MSAPPDQPEQPARSQLEVLLEQARRALATDWRAAEALAEQALKLEPGNLVAKSLRAMAHDRQRQEDLQRCLALVEQKRAARDLKGALAEAERCRAACPLEPRLVELCEALARDVRATEPPKAPPVEAPPPLAPPPKAPPVQRAAVRKHAPGLSAALRARPALVWGITGVATALAMTIIALALFSRVGRQKPPERPIAVEVRTMPPGATIRVNNEVRGTSNLKLELPPGTYHLEAVLEGYQPATSSLEVKSGLLAPVELTLQPIAQSVRLITNLEAAKVSLDDQPSEAMQEEQLALSSLPAGKHTIKVADRYGEASFAFEIVPGAAPAVIAPVTAKNIVALLVSQAAGRARIHVSVPSAKLALDGQPVGEVGPAGLELGNVAAGTHELSLGEGSGLKKFILESGPAPALTAYLQSERNVGTLLLATNEDGVTVFLDGQKHPNVTRRGQLRITRAPKRYRVRVAKEGFQDVPEQEVEIRKGEEVRLAFKLQPAPKLASLSVRGATPGAEVLVDQISIGTVGPDGTFRFSSVSPGEHSVELRKDKHTSAQFRRIFPVGQTVELQGNEVTLRAQLGTLRLTVSPQGAQVTASRAGEGSPRAIPANTVELEEGSWTVVARAPGYQERLERVQIAAGQTVSLNLTLTREQRPPPAKVGGMESWENPQNWTKQGEWYVRRGGNLVLHRATPNGGTFTFTIMLAAGGGLLRGKRLEWVVDFRDPRNHLLFQLDKESFRRTVFVGGRKTETRKSHGLPMPDQITATVQIEVTPTTVTHRFRKGEEWVEVDTVSVPGQNYTVGQFGFVIQGRDEIRLSEFSFRPAK